MNIIPFRSKPTLYEAKRFEVSIGVNTWIISGTICGCVCVYVPNHGSYPLTPDEAQAFILALTASRHDVLDNSSPNDPRLYSTEEGR